MYGNKGTLFLPNPNPNPKVLATSINLKSDLYLKKVRNNSGQLL